MIYQGHIRQANISLADRFNNTGVSSDMNKTALVIIPGVTHMAIINLGDGSAGIAFFSSMEKAISYMKADEERYCDDIIDISRGIEVDPERWL